MIHPLARALAVVAVALTVLASPAAAQYDPPGALTVTPLSPRSGDTITVSVTGCAHSEADVALSIGGIAVGIAAPDANGDFVTDVVVPDLVGPTADVVAGCDGGVLSSVITIDTGDLPFVPDDAGSADGEELDGGAALPRTGSSTSGPLARIGAVLLGLGALLVVFAERRRETVDEPAHAA